MSELVRQADSDQQLISLWLHGKAETTRKAYEYEMRRFLPHLARPIAAATLADLQGYLESLDALAPATQARALNAVKSLYNFAQKIGYIKWNPATPLHAPKIKNTLAERILLEEEVKDLLTVELPPRDRAILRLFYAGALRVSELCSLCWRDLQPRGKTGQVTVFGKGGKTGVVLLPESVWHELRALPGGRSPDDPVFPSRQGGHLSTVQVWRIVKAAGKQAGLNTSCHVLRHSHASHSLDRGASIALVQQTLRHSNVATTSRYLHVRPNESSGDFLSL